MRSALGRSAALLLALAALALPACARMPVSGVYVGSPAHQVYAKLPADWRVLDADAFLAVQVQDPSATVVSGGFVAPFAAPGAGLADVLTSASAPTGVLEYRPLPAPASRQQMVDAAFGNLSALRSSGQAQVSELPDLQGADGSVALSYVVPAKDGKARYVQVAVPDPGGGGFRMLVVGCSLACFAKRSDQIMAVARSFTG